MGSPLMAGFVGAPYARREDERLLTGRGQFTDDIRVPGTVWVAFVRSPLAHGRIRRIDLSRALAAPGVVAAFSGADLAKEWRLGLPCAWMVTPGMVTPDHLPVAVGEVRYQGEIVAAIVATGQSAAADAAGRVSAEFEPLPAVVDVEQAASDTVLVHPDKGTNRCFVYKLEHGDAGRVFSQADVVVRRRQWIPRLIHNALEPRAVLAQPDGDGFTLWSATQMPHALRTMLAMVTSVPEHRLRVIAPDVGGGFGSKVNIYAEEAAALALARRLGRPVKWTETRHEGYLATVQGRGQLQDLAVAATRDGRLLGVSAEVIADLGAYLQVTTPGMPVLGAPVLTGPYRVDAYHYQCTGVFTTKTPTDAMRAPGRVEATLAMERLMDDLAARLGADPLELRARNLIPPAALPFTNVGGATYDSGDYPQALQRAAELLGYHQLRAEQARRNQADGSRRLGIGVASFVWNAGIGRSRLLGRQGVLAGGWEWASVRVLPAGKVEVAAGTSPHGQGHETAFAQIAADVLGVHPDDVTVLHGDTRICPAGNDTYASHSLESGGAAVHIAAQRVLAKAARIAAHLLGVDPRDIQADGATFRARSVPGATTTLPAVAMAAFTGHDLPDGMEPHLMADCTFDPVNYSYPYGTVACAVEVDTETGKTDIRKIVYVHDCGTAVNPALVEGQMHGGVAMGIGQALYEQAIHDTSGVLITDSMAGYHIPRASDLPPITTGRTETPTANNPLGAKGVGESGAIGTPAAVLNAILDALRPLGVHDVPIPATPQHVWEAIQAAGPHPAPTPPTPAEGRAASALRTE